MTKEEWIEKRMDRFQKLFEDRLKDYEYEYLADMYESAWTHGEMVGREEAYRNVQKWREESKT